MTALGQVPQYLLDEAVHLGCGSKVVNKLCFKLNTKVVKGECGVHAASSRGRHCSGRACGSRERRTAWTVSWLSSEDGAQAAKAARVCPLLHGWNPATEDAQ